MSKQDNGFSRRQMSGLTTGLRLSRSMLFGIAAMLMGASLVFTSSTSAHNIDVAKAREIARDYARQVRDESGGKYLHYGTACARNFPGHNHSVRCTINYYNAKDKAAGVYTCRETIELSLAAHTDFMDYRISGRHTSGKCGSRYLNPDQTLG